MNWQGGLCSGLPVTQCVSSSTCSIVRRYVTSFPETGIPALSLCEVWGLWGNPFSLITTPNCAENSHSHIKSITVHRRGILSIAECCNISVSAEAKSTTLSTYCSGPQLSTDGGDNAYKDRWEVGGGGGGGTCQSQTDTQCRRQRLVEYSDYIDSDGNDDEGFCGNR